MKIGNKAVGLLALLVCLLYGSLRAQQSGIGVLNPEMLTAIGRTPSLPSSQSVGAVATVPLESVVDSDEYVVGPSDGIAITITTSPAIVANLVVTPEGTLIVPSVGEVHVASMSLTKAKAVVIGEVRKRFVGAKATVTLTTPRKVLVTVLGQVLVPGSYALCATDRVSGAIEEANQVNRSQRVQEELGLQNLRLSQSRRLIVVRHRDGSEQRVDLDRFASEKLGWLNPYLQAGDVIIVPHYKFNRDLVGVYGAFNLPGTFEFVPGDSLHTALGLAYGLLNTAVRDSVELFRYDPEGRELEHRVLNLDNQSSDLPLQPGDRVVAKEKADFRGDYHVTVIGEVGHPGMVPIPREGMKVTDVIAMAGGLTMQAALSQSVILRGGVSPTQLESEKLASYTGGVPAEDTLYYSVITASRMRGERVTADLVALFEKHDATQDVLLRDGDVVSISRIDPTVYVFGQVVSPGRIAFVAGREASYYVSKAGGVTDRAREGDIRIVKASTKQWLKPGDTQIEEGDYVWVPMNVEHNFAYYLNVVSQAASVIGVAVSLAVLVVQLNK